MLKLTHIGFNDDTVVSMLVVGLKYAPSDCAAAAEMPLIGELIVVYERFSLAVSTFAWAAASCAAVACSLPVESSRSFLDNAFCAASGLTRFRFASAVSCAA